jgi:ribonuclease Z
MKTPRHILVCFSAFTFLALGLACWIWPERAAERFGFEPAHAKGVVNVRADMGALFFGIGLLAAYGSFSRRRAPLLAASLLLAMVVAGRLLGGLLSGASALGAGELALELAALAALGLRLRGLREPDTEDRAHVSTWRVALGACTGLLLLAGGALLVPGVQQSLFDRAALAKTGRVNLAPFDDDALRVAIAGSSAPLPSARRAKASVVVFAGGKFWVVDSGPESVENLLLWGIPMSRIGGVLLTHFHSDHIGDLGELQLQTWAGGRSEKLAVYGGPGVESVVDGFNRAYALDQGYRTAHHGETVMPSAAWGMRAVTVELDGPRSPAKDRSARVYDDGSLRITALEVDHAPIEPAYAFRFDYKGRSVVVSGDLKYHRPLVQGAAGSDLLVSEAISRTLTRSLEHAAHAAGRSNTEAIMHDVQDYHISPEEAASLANEARVRHLAFYHLLPAPDGWLMRQLFARGVNEVRPAGWSIADDGTLYTLPIGSV